MIKAEEKNGHKCTYQWETLSVGQEGSKEAASAANVAEKQERSEKSRQYGNITTIVQQIDKARHPTHYSVDFLCITLLKEVNYRTMR